MERGLYIAASGMLAEQIRQDQIANDLANASTPGYKADRTTQTGFGELLLRNSVHGRVRRPAGHGRPGRQGQTDFSPQAARDTGEPLDFAIVGEGFFAVQTAQGVRYTRNGQFIADAQGRLVTPQGDPVLGRGGQPLTVGADGTRRSAHARRRQPHQPAQGRRQPRHRHAGRHRHRPVRSGALEGSGADAARSMVDMIASMRAFEAGQKVIQTIDETLGKASTQVGSLNG